MQNKEITEILAPCGLDCSRCLARKGSDIQQAATSLVEQLSGLEKQYKRFAQMDPVFESYPAFAEMAEFMATGRCTGCRNGDCLFAGCSVQSCVVDKGVDFCFQCDEFPCDETNFPPGLEKKWRVNNGRMKEIGVEAFLAETRDKPRY